MAEGFCYLAGWGPRAGGVCPEEFWSGRSWHMCVRGARDMSTSAWAEMENIPPPPYH